MPAPKFLESALADLPGTLPAGKAFAAEAADAARAMLGEAMGTARVGRVLSDLQAADDWQAPASFRIKVRSSEGDLESISPGEFHQRFGVTYARRLKYDSDFPRHNLQTEVARHFPDESRRTFIEERFASRLNARHQYKYTEPIMDWLYGDQVRSGQVADVYLAKVSDKVGHGLFAGSDFRKGQFIGEYTGLAVREVFARSPSEGSYVFSMMPCVSEVDALEVGNYTRFANHSFRPNIAATVIIVDNERHVVFLANSPIAKDRQLLLHYGPRYWKDRPAPQELLP